MNEQKLPTLSDLYIPILEVLGNDSIHRKELKTRVKKHYDHLPAELLERRVSSGANALLLRIGWASVDLKFAKLIEYPERGYRQITAKGKKVLATGKFGSEELNKDSDHIEYWKEVKKRRGEKISETATSSEGVAPEETIDEGIKQFEQGVKTELLERLRDVDPYEFESVVMQLLDKMNYGEVVVTKRAGDDGIDGIVNEDPLGLSKIYMQAKRYKDGNSINQRQIQSFIGAMGSVTKGVFVTTSKFDDKAKTWAEQARVVLILIDGEKLVDLMYQYGVGVEVANEYSVKKIDDDFLKKITPDEESSGAEEKT